MFKNNSRICIIIVAVIFFTYSQCLATTIIAIRTPEVFTIAADSAGTFISSSKPLKQELVCKIYQKGGVLYAIAGLTKDAKRGYDPAEIIASSLHDTQPLLSSVNKIETIMRKAVKNELTKLRTEDPKLFIDELKETTIIISCFENDQPVAIGIQFLGTIDGQGKILIRTKRLSCPGNCPKGTYTFFLGKTKAIENYVAIHGSNFTMSPEESVMFMVQLEINAKTPGVGPPIDVVRLNKNGITWLYGKAQCKQ